MKKLILLLFCAVAFVSCDMDDDGPAIAYKYAEVISADLPDFVEPGETYEIDITVLKPSACHDFYTFDTNEDDLDLFVHPLLTFDPRLTECDEEDEDLTVTETIEFTPNAEEGETYTFHFLTDKDEEGDPEYMTMELPVGAPDDNGEDEDDEDDDNGDDEDNGDEEE